MKTVTEFKASRGLKASLLSGWAASALTLGLGNAHAQVDSSSAAAEEQSPAAPDTSIEPTPAAASGSLIEEVVVTSQKRSENLQDVPIAVTALTGDSLAASAIDAQSSLPQITPNLQVNSAANFVSPYLRGVGTQYANPGLESSVATYFDDQYLSRASGNMFSFSDVDHIEVLKGPQGTLYGRNATGGAIRIITKDPTERFEAKLSTTAGNYGRLGGEGLISGEIAPGLLDRLVIQYDSNDGYVKNLNPDGPKMQDRNQYVIRNKLIWKPADALSIKLTADYGEKKDREGQAFISLDTTAPIATGVAVGGTPGRGPEYYGGDAQNGDDDSSKFHNRAGGVALRADYETSVATLSSITGMRYTKFSGLADLDTTSATLLHAKTVADKTLNLTQEFQVVSNGDGPFKWIGGLYLLKETSSVELGLFGDAIGPDTLVGGKGKVDIHSIAPYGQASYAFNSQWEATVGARYTLESKELLYNRLYTAGVNDQASGPAGPRNVYFVTPSETNSFQQFSPKFVLSYKPLDNVMLYGSVSRGFKSGGFNLPNPTNTTVDSVNPETLTAYELGWKTQGERVRFNGAAFYYDYKNLQVETTDTSSGALTRVTNAATATIQGVEFDLSYALARGFEIGTGGGYLDASFEKFIGDAYVPSYTTAACANDPTKCVGYTTVSADLSGNDLPMAPEFSGYVRLNYSTSLGKDWGTLSFAPVYSYTSGYNYTADESVKESSRGLLNASLTWMSDDGHYDVTLFGTNLTDEVYYQSRTRFPATGGWQVPAAPLQYGIRLSYTF